MSLFSLLLENSLTRGLDLNDPQTTELRKRIILNKSFLRKVYQKWYNQILINLPSIDGAVLELGTGAGFLRDYIPKLITSDILPIKGCDVTCNALNLPFADNSLKTIIMLNVLHHVPDVDNFFNEGVRCLKKSGKLIMIEPWYSPWSKFIYTKFHHEPFEPLTSSWELPPGGPLSGGNDALPWIIFNRDCERFKRVHPSWQVESIAPGFPLSYLLSGGISLRSLFPGCMFGVVGYLEDSIPKRFVKKTAMFAMIILCNTKNEIGAENNIYSCDNEAAK